MKAMKPKEFEKKITALHYFIEIFEFHCKYEQQV